MYSGLLCLPLLCVAFPRGDYRLGLPLKRVFGCGFMDTDTMSAGEASRDAAESSHIMEGFKQAFLPLKEVLMYRGVAM